ncbi:MAG TPA: hypothetical protein VJ815_10915 [Acidimicrobiia bacterium]|jgi:hypothetical protein|nr:hypothetical protein [Acidimicrobiia bacterium]
MRRLLPWLVVAIVVSVALPAVAAPPVTETGVDHGITETFVEFFDCEGTLYEITVVYTLIEHSTVFDDGRAHFTFTQTGTFDAIPLDPSQPDASGHFAVWGGFNQNNSTVNGTFTFNVNGEYEDGGQISTHAVDHFNVIPSGTEFFFSRCHD